MIRKFQTKLIYLILEERGFKYELIGIFDNLLEIKYFPTNYHKSQKKNLIDMVVFNYNALKSLYFIFKYTKKNFT